MTLRCVLDGLLLPAQLRPGRLNLLAFDGDEPFRLVALEAVFYELVTATAREVQALEQRGYRLLRQALDFERVPE